MTHLMRYKGCHQEVPREDPEWLWELMVLIGVGYEKVYAGLVVVAENPLTVIIIA